MQICTNRIYFFLSVMTSCEAPPSVPCLNWLLFGLPDGAVEALCMSHFTISYTACCEPIVENGE